MRTSTLGGEKGPASGLVPLEAGARATGRGHLWEAGVQVLQTHFGSAVQVGLRPALLAVIDDQQGAGGSGRRPAALAQPSGPAVCLGWAQKVTPQVQAVMQVLIEARYEASMEEPTPCIALQR